MFLNQGKPVCLSYGILTISRIKFFLNIFFCTRFLFSVKLNFYIQAQHKQLYVDRFVLVQSSYFLSFGYRKAIFNLQSLITAFWYFPIFLELLQTSALLELQVTIKKNAMLSQDPNILCQCCTKQTNLNPRS